MNSLESLQVCDWYRFSYDLVAIILRRTNIIEDHPSLMQAIVANVLRPGWYATNEARDVDRYIALAQVEVSVSRDTRFGRQHWLVEESEASRKLRLIDGSYSGIEFSDYNPLTGTTSTTTY